MGSRAARFGALGIVLGVLAGCDAAPGAVVRTSDVPSGRTGPSARSEPSGRTAARAVSCEPTGTAVPQTTWRVRRGDTAADVARRVYGDERFAAEIARANPGRVGRRGELTAGTDLVLPRDVR